MAVDQLTGNAFLPDVLMVTGFLPQLDINGQYVHGRLNVHYNILRENLKVLWGLLI